MKKYLILLIVLLALFLRLINLASNPPSLYWEEAAIGFDAYSILKTGKDFHGNSWPLVAFESFGDYKPSAYFYLTVPSIVLFGLTELAVRLPSALLGTLTVYLIYLLIKKLSKNSTTATISALFLAISPWHLQLSRAGFEANAGLFLVTLGAWLFIKGLIKKPYLYYSVIAWALSLYTYHANRVFVPLLGLSFGLLFAKKLVKQKLHSILAVCLFVIICTPLAIRLADPKVSIRFQQTSAFTTLEPIIRSNLLIEQDGGGLAPRIIHHRFFQYSKIFLNHYFDHFTNQFLFLSGDFNPRHSTQAVGSFYLIQLPLIIWGLIQAKKQKNTLPLIIWLFLAPIPAALTKATPHALRSLSLIIPLTYFSALGMHKLKKPLIIGVSLILLLETSRYMYHYHQIYSAQHSSHWQYGYQPMVEYVNKNQDKYDQIFITRDYGRPSIYYWFYSQTDPAKVQAQAQTATKDQGEFLEFDQIQFGSPPSQIPANCLIVTSANAPIINSASQLKEIYDLNHQLVFRIYET